MAEREEWSGETLWNFAKARGLSRRRFLLLMASGGAAAVLAACGLTETSGTPRDLPSEPAGGYWFKDPSPLFAHDDGKSLEARLENTRGLVTANSHFFVRNNSTSRAIAS